MGFQLQFSIGIALIGLIPLRFEELVGEVAPAANPCDPTDCLRKWFALLSSEQQLFFKAYNLQYSRSCTERQLFFYFWSTFAISAFGYYWRLFGNALVPIANISNNG
ncbi:hypothetical protein HAX54_034113 [Datura stramonium]|uniref:Uncharacterized protein n=1 Tax=Datura stramonium TaxID=4076 RepID=A0ABS8Y8W3_DATST|nr:hypothetical protein [Datura stramonium]